MSLGFKVQASLWPKLGALAMSASIAVAACSDDDSNTPKDAPGGAGGESSVDGGAGPDGGRAGEPTTAAGADNGGTPGNGTGGAAAGAGGDLGGAGSGAGAGGTGGVGEPVEGCDVNSTYGNLGDLEGAASEIADAVFLEIPLQAGTPADQINVELFDDSGVFEDGVTTGTFALTGDELDFSSCGLCITLLEDAAGSSFRGRYMATGGTVTLTSVEGRITGTLSNVTFEHVTINPDDGVTTPHPDGCTTSVESLGFDAPIIPLQTP